MSIAPEYLVPGLAIDSDHELVVDYAHQVVDSSTDPIAKAVKLYYAIRDDIKYDPYCPLHLPEHYRASTALQKRRSFCIPKAALLCATARVHNIPSRIGFANVRNHLATRQLIKRLGSNLFVYHGYSELYLNGIWVKATPTFNRELCYKHKVQPLEFNGRDDSLFHAYNTEQKKFMEYVVYHGTYADVPVDTIIQAVEDAYGKDMLENWKNLQKAKFECEDVV